MSEVIVSTRLRFPGVGDHRILFKQQAPCAHCSTGDGPDLLLCVFSGVRRTASKNVADHFAVDHKLAPSGIRIVIADPDDVDNQGACNLTEARVPRGALIALKSFVSHCIVDVMTEPLGSARLLLIHVGFVLGHLRS